MEREEVLLHAAQSAFAAAFAGARVVDWQLQLGAGVRWSWLAEMPGGALCAVLVLPFARGEHAWAVLDGATTLGEQEAELRRSFGLAPPDPRAAPRVLVIAEDASRSFERRVAHFDARRIEVLGLVRIASRSRNHAALSVLRAGGPGRSPAAAQRAHEVERFAAAFAGDVDLLELVRQRVLRLDPSVESESAEHGPVFTVHGHELARVCAAAPALVMQVGVDAPPVTLTSGADVERFLGRVVERYLELGCWTGAEGGAASLALSEPLLSHEELAAFRELA